MLGTSADDPAFTPTILDPIIQQAVDSLLAAIHDANPNFLTKTAVLTAESPTAHSYRFATQAVPIGDFDRWLEVRYTDEDGAQLDEARLEELHNFGGDYFAFTDPDDAPVLITSKDTEAGVPIWLRYSYWTPELTGDGSAPTGIPVRFHDVVALEALFAFGLGGEQRLPPELRERWFDRRGQMLARVGRRGVTPSRTKLLRVDE